LVSWIRKCRQVIEKTDINQRSFGAKPKEKSRPKKTAITYVLSITSILNRDCILRKGN